MAADLTDAQIEALLAACGLKMPPPCGTVPAYMRHLSIRETPCQPCQATFQAARTGWASKPRRRQPIAHGTTAGARAHQARHEAACGPCANAIRQYRRDYDARRLTARQPTTEGAP